MREIKILKKKSRDRDFNEFSTSRPLIIWHTQTPFLDLVTFISSIFHLLSLN